MVTVKGMKEGISLTVIEIFSISAVNYILYERGK